MLTEAQLASLAEILPKQQVLTGRTLLAAYEMDGSVFRGAPEAVVLPVSGEDVQRLAAWALENKVTLVGRGSGTGLTGGAIAQSGGVVVSFTRMNRILSLDAGSFQVVVEPGVITQRLQNSLANQDLYYPPDPASFSVCSIGGNIAENAGGPHCLKYGITRRYVQALEVVLPGGEMLWLGSPAADPPEYDFASLFTGSEGTLGLLTRAVLRLRQQPKAVKALTASFESIESAGRAVTAVISAGLLPATIELMDRFMIQIVEEYLHAGFPTQAGAMLIFDVDGYPGSLDSQLDEIAAILGRFNPIEVKLARTPQERDAIWLGRRSSVGAIARLSPSHYGVDVCVPRLRFAEALQRFTEFGAQYGLPISYVAHAGDGNMHPLVICNMENPEEEQRVHQLSDAILRAAADMGGTIGGEHGMGVEKRHALPFMYSGSEIHAMRQAKSVFDPQNIMNPSVIFPEEIPGDDQQRRSVELPPAMFIPFSADEAAAGLKQLQADHRQVYITGSASQWRGEPPGMQINSRYLDQILDISADDFYIRLQSGVQLDNLQAALLEKGFWFPHVSPWAGTVGGLISTGLNCPLRGLYTSLRELLLSIQVALPDGRLLRLGRPLMKDVAGLDLVHLFCGSQGTLGFITEMCLRISALPRQRLSLSYQTSSLELAVQSAAQLLKPASLCAGLVVTPDPDSHWQVSLTLEGHPKDIQAERQAVLSVLNSLSYGEITESPGSLASDSWLNTLKPAAFAARLACLPPSLVNLSDRLDSNTLEKLATIDLPSGTVYFTLLEENLEISQNLLNALHRAAASLGGHAAWLSGPRRWLPNVDAWGPARPTLPYMRRLKEFWDPAGIVNRGEFVV